MMPAGMTEAEYIQMFKDEKDRTGADGYYLLHNHPSGNPTPSREDIKLTEVVAARIPGLLAHVVINSNRYAIIWSLPRRPFAVRLHDPTRSGFRRRRPTGGAAAHVGQAPGGLPRTLRKRQASLAVRGSR